MAKITHYTNPPAPLVTVDSMVESLVVDNKLDDETHREILELARKAILSGGLHSHDGQTTARVTDISKATPLVIPQKFNEWVNSTGMTFKLPSIKPKRIRVKKQTAQTNNWKLRVQMQATKHILALRKGGANPTVLSIIKDIHAWCVDNNVRAIGGLVPSPGYIRTHALGGRYWSPPP